MAALQDAVRIMLALLAAALVAASVVAPTLAQEAGGMGAGEREVVILYDRTQPAYLLFDYKLRVMVLVSEGAESCWMQLPNGTVSMICQPLRKTTVKAYYQELHSYAEATTDDEGVAEFTFRLITFPRASFRVSVYSPEGSEEVVIQVFPKPWTILLVTSFSAMVAALVFAVRRCVW